ncbi:MAG TPA: hypothetical protein DCX06_01895 [Opitutae bacterium]|nr:hypothetical protein [Opitutae bacterium]
MKTYEEFVESREQMDPSARKMTDHQWKQAYVAYCSSRERVRKPSSPNSKRTKASGAQKGSRRQHSKSIHLSGGALLPETAHLKQRVREQSAYRDLRLIIDVLAWVAIAVLIINALLKMSLMVNVYATVSVLIEGALGVLIAFSLKQLIQVLIDIPDIALYRIGESQSAQSNDEKQNTE